jgi:short-chain Z-isoprenyl diphosphate synthase
MLKRLLYRLYERQLLAEVLAGPLPRHVGLIQDGHRRYSRDAGLARLSEGYRIGADKTEEVLIWCARLDIPTVTLWALSTDNLSRPEADVADILRVIAEKMAEWVQDGGLAERLRMRIRPIGLLDLLPPSALAALRTAEAATRHHDGRLLNVAVGYGGRQEIVDAVKGHLRDCFGRGDRPDEIIDSLTPGTVDKYLYTYDCPDPDLIIRTSGEVRLSGFMLWQSAYSEFYFSDVHWPAFRRIDFLRAIRSYQRRQRRFGR